MLKLGWTGTRLHDDALWVRISPFQTETLLMMKSGCRCDYKNHHYLIIYYEKYIIYRLLIFGIPRIARNLPRIQCLNNLYKYIILFFKM